jgi:hypothetical protein
MKLPIGKISGQQIDDLFNQSINYHIDIFYKTIAEYEPNNLYSDWRTIIRSIEEIINIPGELDSEEECNKFLHLKFDFMDSKNLPPFKDVIDILERQFENKVAERFKQIALMSNAINMSFQMKGIFEQQ